MHRRNKTMRHRLKCKIFFVIITFFSAIFLLRLTKKETSLSPISPRNFTIIELMGSRNTLEVVKPNISTIILKPSKPFGKGSYKRPFAVIGVISQARFFDQRRAIRTSWYKWAEELNIRIFFMIGFHDFRKQELYKFLDEEHRRFDDLIVDNYEEGYYKLTGKVLRMLKWYNSTYTTENAPRFFIKTDHDVFLQLPNIVKALKKTSYYKSLAGCDDPLEGTCFIPDTVNLPFDQTNPDTYYVGGQKLDKAPMQSGPDSKWYIDSTQKEQMGWTWEFYPTYAEGPCYIISGNAVRTIYDNSFHVSIFPFEDVYIIGMVAYQYLNLTISQLNGMCLHLDLYCTLMRWNMFNGHILAWHSIERPKLMIKLCKKIRACRRLLKNKSYNKSLPNHSASYTPKNHYFVSVISILLSILCPINWLRVY